MNQDSTSEIIRTFLVEEVLEGSANSLSADTPLLEWGVLTSISTMRLLSFITQRFGIQVPVDDVAGGNFKDIGSIARLVDQLVSAAPTGQ